MNLFEDTSRRVPSDYFAEMRDTPGVPFENVLASHGLPADATSFLLRDDYEAFLTWRQQWLWQEIQRVTGVVGQWILRASETEAA